MDIYERYGRLQERYEAECEAHVQTVGLLRALTQGALSLDCVSVTDENRWTITPQAPRIVIEPESPQGLESVLAATTPLPPVEMKRGNGGGWEHDPHSA